jgi:hypothetical protein
MEALLSGIASTISFLSTPSGRFPGDGGEAPLRGLLTRYGGERRPRLNRFFLFYSRVFSAYFEGWFVNFIFEALCLIVSHRRWWMPHPGL